MTAVVKNGTRRRDLGANRPPHPAVAVIAAALRGLPDAERRSRLVAGALVMAGQLRGEVLGGRVLAALIGGAELLVTVSDAGGELYSYDIGKTALCRCPEDAHAREIIEALNEAAEFLTRSAGARKTA